MSKQFEQFVPFVKVDEAKREVYGVVTAEVCDKVGETCHYDSTKEQYKAWSDEFSKATDGKNLGNLREMHQLKAVGKGIDLTFNDSAKEIVMGFKVVDEDAWQKVVEDVYTGFSHGGRMLKTWKEKGTTYYTAQPTEVSLVDNPCLGTARFAFIRADGAVEMRKVRSAELPTRDTRNVVLTVGGIGLTQAEVLHLHEAIQKAAGEPDGGVIIDSSAGCQCKCTMCAKCTGAATKGAGGCANGCSCANCQKCMNKSAKSDIHPSNEVIIKSFAALALAKGMSEVGELASLLSQLNWIQRYSEMEAEYEGDNSPVPAALLDQLKSLIAVFLQMAAEEAAELTERDKSGDAFAFATVAEIKKVLPLFAKAVERCEKAGTPATTEGDIMSDKNTQGTGTDVLAAKLDTLIELMSKSLTPKTAEPVAPIVPAVATPAAVVAEPVAVVKTEPANDLVKAFAPQVETMLKGFQDEFKGFMTEIKNTLETPKAAANARAVTKAEDNSVIVKPEVEQEVSFQPKIGKGLETSDAYKAALGKVSGLPL